MMTKKQHRLKPSILAAARELREPLTPAERKLWARLRDRQLDGIKFRCQHPIGRFVVDFYCAACGLVIEIDGDSHAEQVEYDRARTVWLNEQGYRVIRFFNGDVYERIDAVLEAILAECEKQDSPSPPPLSLGGRGELAPSPRRGEGRG
jgi:very-short-patch-repair endonuclease